MNEAYDAADRVLKEAADDPASGYIPASDTDWRVGFEDGVTYAAELLSDGTTDWKTVYDMLEPCPNCSASPVPHRDGDKPAIHTETRPVAGGATNMAEARCVRCGRSSGETHSDGMNDAIREAVLTWNRMCERDKGRFDEPTEPGLYRTRSGETWERTSDAFAPWRLPATHPWRPKVDSVGWDTLTFIVPTRELPLTPLENDDAAIHERKQS